MAEGNNSNAIVVAIIGALAVVLAGAFQGGFFTSDSPSPEGMSDEAKSCLAHFNCEAGTMAKVKVCRETAEGSQAPQAKKTQLIKDCYSEMATQLRVCWSPPSNEAKNLLSAQCKVTLENEGIDY